MCLKWLILVVFSALSFSVSSQTVENNYRSFCASCHGKDMSGGMGPALNDQQWKHGADHQSITQVILNGVPRAGMPAFKKSLSAEDIRALTIFIQEQAHDARSQQRAETSLDQVFSAKGHHFKLEKLVGAPGELWGLDFLPDGDILVTQIDGVLWRIKGSKLHEIEGIPSVLRQGQGGLLDVRVDPDYANNGWVYLSYSEPKAGKSMTKVVRGIIKKDKWQSQEVVYQAPESSYGTMQHHYGSRIVIQGNHVFFTVGDRGVKEQAQNLHAPMGKVHRVTKDGKIPKDNPWADGKEALSSIWTWGHRNPQGMAIHPQTGEIWVAEHGPRGGDEINLLNKGNNYGWPTITYGMNYDGTPMTDKTSAEGMQQPKHYWVPSIAVSDIEFYRGNVFSRWQNHLLVSSLAKQEARLLTVSADNSVTADDLLFKGLGRIRDIAVDANGYPLVLLNNSGGGSVYRLVPVDPGKTENVNQEKSKKMDNGSTDS